MCVTCGCGDMKGVTLSVAARENEHVHADGTRHSHTDGGHHAHSHGSAGAFARAPLRQPMRELSHAAAVPGRDSHTIRLETQILGKNQLVAERNRGWLAGRQILALNLVSSPGAGKTSLLESTLNDLKGELKISVVEGDQATSNDAERIRATGVRAVQINTGTGCHLEADMLERALRSLNPEMASLLLIENVGNLVCPALFDLGERAKVVIFSVTEGEDKPLKYPHMFAAAEVVILSKVDLLPHVRFDAERAIENALTVNPRLAVFRVSAYTGEGMREWYDWLRGELVLSMNGGSHATSWQPVTAG
jgi:hydrogenase nickel incorporation protein HypB